LSELTSLDQLGLAGTQVSDAGLVHLKGFTKLTGLWLQYTQVSDAGLVHLQGLTILRTLYLTGTQVSDAGLDQLKGLRRLKEINVAQPRVPAAGMERLSAALPNCIIIDDDRRAAEWVLSIGGKVTVRVGDSEQVVAAARGLPAGRFQLAKVNLDGNQ